MRKVSFVIPSYNRAFYLAHAIESCQKQTYLNIEIVVVDDCSTDSTPKFLAYVADRDRRIKVIRNEVNKGASESRNIGNRAATGDIICVLDSDDIAYHDRAKITVDKMKEADFFYGACQDIDCIGNKLGVRPADVFNKERASTGERLNHIVHSCSAYTKEIALRFPYRDGDISRLGIDDWAMQTEIFAADIKYEFTPQIIGAYRELSDGLWTRRDPVKTLEVKEKFQESLKVPV